MVWHLKYKNEWLETTSADQNKSRTCSTVGTQLRIDFEILALCLVESIVAQYRQQIKIKAPLLRRASVIKNASSVNSSLDGYHLHFSAGQYDSDTTVILVYFKHNLKRQIHLIWLISFLYVDRSRLLCPQLPESRFPQELSKVKRKLFRKLKKWCNSESYHICL